MSAEGIRINVSFIAQMFDRGRPKAPFNPWRLWMARAKEYSETFSPDEMSPPKRCFNNSIEMCIKNGWGYVEGFITIHGVPLTHAWNLDNQGRAFDTTLKPGDVQNYTGMLIPSKLLFMAATHKRWMIAEGVIGTICMMNDQELKTVEKILRGQDEGKKVARVEQKTGRSGGGDRLSSRSRTLAATNLD